MGSSSSKIETTKIPLEQIKATNPVEQTRFCPPFRKFKSPVITVTDKRLRAELEVEEPTVERITIEEDYFSDL